MVANHLLHWRSVVSLCAIASASWLAASADVKAAPIVPGTGQILEEVGDDFEDPEWSYTRNDPKSSLDLDGNQRLPGGRSTNGRWRENTDRGHPDIVRRVPTPEGGLPGSAGALLLMSKATGIPGRPSGKGEQDDIYMNVRTRVGHYVSVRQGPSVVVRVYMPPFEQWEDRTGSSFALRATVRGAKPGQGETEPYWPGIFVQHKRDRDRRKNESPAFVSVRAANPGNDYRVKSIDETGWWTMGMSFTPDGQVHYYAHPGIEDLTSADYLASHYPYGFRCQNFIDVFFDVFGANNGQTWTTPWIIDDPTVYLAYPPQLDQARQPKKPVR